MLGKKWNNWNSGIAGGTTKCTATLENSLMIVCNKVNRILIIWPSNSTLICPWHIKTYAYKKFIYLKDYRRFIYNNQIAPNWKEPIWFWLCFYQILLLFLRVFVLCSSILFWLVHQPLWKLYFLFIIQNTLFCLIESFALSSTLFDINSISLLLFGFICLVHFLIFLWQG